MNDDVGFLADHLGSLFHTQDGGKTWVDVLHTPISSRPNIEYFFTLSFPTMKVGFAGSTNCLFRTLDGGITWDPLGHNDPSDPFMLGLDVEGPGNVGMPEKVSWVFRARENQLYMYLLAVGFVNATKGYASALGGALLVSSNGGRTWSKLPHTESRAIKRFHFLKDETCIAVGFDGIILRINTANDQITLIESGAVAMLELESVSFSNAETGLIVGAGGTLIKTVDGGRSWNRDFVPSETWLTDVSFFNENDAIAVGFGGVILRSEDAGSSWHRMNLPIDNYLYSVSTPSRSTGYIAGAEGLLLKTRDAGRTFYILRFQSS